MLKEEQVQEAIKRIKLINFHENVLKDFVEDEKINKSEAQGFLYWLRDEEEDMIKKWEEETGNLVYHVLFTETAFGDMLSFFYVSKYKSEWEMDREDLLIGNTVAYVKNLEYDINSEFGTIVFESKMGGLVRTA